MNPNNTIFDAKRLIGRKFNDSTVQSDRKHWPFQVVEQNSLPRLKVEYQSEEKTFTPEEISSMELISSGVKVFSSLWYSTFSLGREFCSMTWKDQCFLSDCTVESLNFLPINLLASKMVLFGFMATWFFAASPINLSVSVKAT